MSKNKVASPVSGHAPTQRAELPMFPAFRLLWTARRPFLCFGKKGLPKPLTVIRTWRTNGVVIICGVFFKTGDVAEWLVRGNWNPRTPGSMLCYGGALWGTVLVCCCCHLGSWETTFSLWHQKPIFGHECNAFRLCLEHAYRGCNTIQYNTMQYNTIQYNCIVPVGKFVWQQIKTLQT